MKKAAPKKTSQKESLSRRVAAMKLGHEFTVGSKDERVAAINCGRELFNSGTVPFKIRTWFSISDNTFTIRAVKP